MSATAPLAVPREKKAGLKLVRRERPPVYRPKQDGDLKMYDPLEAGGAGYLTVPNQFRDAWLRGAFRSDAQAKLVYLILEGHYGNRKRLKNDTYKPPVGWVYLGTDKAVGKIVGLGKSEDPDFRILIELKYDLWQRGICDARLVGNRWLFRLNIESLKTIPKWVAPKVAKAQPVTEEITGEEEANQTAVECGSQISVLKPGTTRPFRLSADTEPVRVHSQYSSNIVVGAGHDSDGPLLVIRESPVTAASPSPSPPRSTMEHTAVSNDADLKSASPPGSKRAAEKERSQELFEAFSMAYELGGRPLGESALECKSLWAREDAATQQTILEDVIIRFDTTWREPRFTLPALKYLRQREWATNPITKRQLASPKREKTRDEQYREHRDWGEKHGFNK